MTREKLNQLIHRRDDLADIYAQMGLYAKSARVRDCMNNVDYSDKSTDSHIIINHAWFCGDRWCPICQWRQANGASYEMRNLNSEIIAESDDDHCYRMVTLTVPNVTADELHSKILEMGKAWSKIIRRDLFRRSVKGWVKVLDITYNRETSTYHPHLHIATCHVSSYGKNVGYYITSAQWLKMWQEAMNDSTITQVYDGAWDDIAHAVGYASIPTNDDDSEIPVTEEIMSVLIPAFKWKRRLVKGGIYRSQK